MGYLGEVGLGGTITAHFATNDTGGTGGDATNATASVRQCGTTASSVVAPITAGVNTYLLSDAGFPAGCYEVEVAATIANGFTASQWYAVYANATIDAETPTGFLGKFFVSTASKRTYDAASTVIDYLDAAVTSRAPSSTALDNNIWTTSRAVYLDTLSTGVTLAAGQQVSTASNVGTVGTVAGTVNAEVVTKTGFSLAADQSGVTIGTASNANVTAISGDATAADNLETMLDGTGGKKLTLEQLVISSTTVGGAVDIDNTAGPAVRITSQEIGGEGGTIIEGYAGTPGLVLDGGAGAQDLRIAGGSVTTDIGGTITTASNVGTVASVTNGVTIASGQTVATASNAPSAAAIADAIGQRVPDGNSSAGSFDWSIGLQSMRLRDVETATAATSATRTLYKPDGTTSWGTYVVNTSASGAYQITGTSDS